MDTWWWVVIVAAAVLVVVLVLAGMMRGRRRAALRDRFGPEYERTVEAVGSRRAAEVDLRDRETRRAQIELHPLAPESRVRYLERWAAMQTEFIDRPQVAVADADSLITQAMREVGYPVDDFAANADLLSVDHATIVARYRHGHDIYTKTVEGRATTEELRQAILSYRVLFEELLRDDADVSS